MRKLLQVFFWALIVCAVVEITNEGRDVAAFGLGKISLDVEKFGTKFGDVGDGLVAEGVCIDNFSRKMEMGRVGLGFGKDLRRIATPAILIGGLILSGSATGAVFLLCHAGPWLVSITELS
jgi:hypothetical protein